jgi:hypothetical protein
MSPTLQVLVDIPVESTAVGDEVRVQQALAVPDDPAPSAGSHLWGFAGAVPVGDLPATLTVGPHPRGHRLWYRASSWEEGHRVSNWTAPASILLEAIAFLESLVATLGQGRNPRLYWTPGGLAEGVKVRWSVQPIGVSPALDSTNHIEASVGTFDPGTTLPTGDSIVFEVEAWDDFEAGEVAGELGATLSRSLSRPIGDAPGGDLCRLVLTDDLELIYSGDLCVVITAGD